MGAPPNLLPDHMDGSMSYSVVSYLKKVKHQAKLEAERLTNLHSNPHPNESSQFNIPPWVNYARYFNFVQLPIFVKKICQFLKNVQITPSVFPHDWKSFEKTLTGAYSVCNDFYFLLFLLNTAGRVVTCCRLIKVTWFEILLLKESSCQRREDGGF